MTKAVAPEMSHRFPQFLPDGRHFLVCVETAAQPARQVATIELGSLDSTEMKTANRRGFGRIVYGSRLAVVGARRRPRCPASERCPGRTVRRHLFRRQSGVLRQQSCASVLSILDGPRDLSKRQPGGATPLARPLGESPAKALAEPEERDGANPFHARVSPDGRQVVTHRRARDRSDLWLVDDTHASRFTFDGAGNPVWSPDGRQIAFGAGERQGSRYFLNFYRKPADSSQDQVRIVGPLPDISALDDWSPDGGFLVYQSVNAQTGYDLWTVPLEGDHTPHPFLQTRFDEKYGRFSPDGRWMAYTSNESGEVGSLYPRVYRSASFRGWERSGRRRCSRSPPKAVSSRPGVTTGRN